MGLIGGIKKYMPSPGEVSGYAALAAVLMQQAPRVWALMSRDKVLARKASLQELQAHQIQLDKSYERLERENQRLSEDIEELRQLLDKERKAHAKTRRWCEHLEYTLRVMGWKRPSGPQGPVLNDDSDDAAEGG